MKTSFKAIRPGAAALGAAFLTAALCAALAAFAPACRAAKPVTVEAKADKTTIHIGDRINYTVDIRYEPEVELDLPNWGTNLGSFDILDFEKKGPKKEDGLMVLTLSFAVSTYDTGTYDIDPIEIQYEKKGAGETKSVKTEKIEIKVDPIASEEARQIQENNRPFQLETPLKRHLPWYAVGAAGALIVLIVAAKLLARWARKRREMRPEIVDTRSPEEIARSEFDRLAGLGLLQKGEVKNFYIELADIVRRYLHRKYGVATLERTTEEIMSDLLDVKMDAEARRRVDELLRKSDLVKFARLMPERRECDDDLGAARGAVELCARKKEKNEEDEEALEAANAS